MDYGEGLENLCREISLPWVRIPLSPHKLKLKKNKKTILLLLLLILGAIFVWFVYPKFTGKGSTTSETIQSMGDEQYVLDGYPMKEVPLFENTKISAMKYIVNQNPQNIGGYFGLKMNYYNVVYKTDKSAETILAYYKSLMSETSSEFSNSNRVVGKIGKYLVEASHYGEDTEDVYLQVHLPGSEFSETNKFFSSYPETITVNSNWIEYENGYGRLNQVGGQIEYSAFYEIRSNYLEESKLTVKEALTDFYKEYKEMYSDKTDLKAYDSEQRLTWKDGENSNTVVFKEDHGRIYLNTRKPLK